MHSFHFSCTFDHPDCIRILLRKAIATDQDSCIIYSSTANPVSFMDLSIHGSFTGTRLLSAVIEGASGFWPLYPFHMISA